MIRDRSGGVGGRTSARVVLGLILLVISAATLASIGPSLRYFRRQRQIEGKRSIETPIRIMLFDKEHQQQVDLQSLIDQLSAEDRVMREVAQKGITRLALQSDENRKAVIAELLKAAEMPAFRHRLESHSVSASYLWAGVGEILGNVQAREAIDLLISCVDCTAITESVTDTYHHKPAVRALLGMESLAVPKLSVALGDPNPEIRGYAALTLGLIGGNDAKEALIRAFKFEQDIKVRKWIQGALGDIDGQSRPYHAPLK
jgi:HEAT repeats